MSSPSCPDRNLLLAYHRGTLLEDSAEGLIEHLSGCSVCQRIVDDFRGADDAFSRLRQPLENDPYDEEPERQAALARARSIVRGEQALAGQSSGGSAAVLALPAQWGEYQLLEQLGEGGMGAVYKARQTNLDRLVAIKVLSRRRAGDEHAVARFYREMKAVGRVDHPNIVRAMDARELDGKPVLVMEYVAGLNLRAVVAKVGRLSIPDACELVRQAALGLQCAHENRLVHRDIKPSNLMLAFSDQPSAVSGRRERGGEKLMAESCLLKASLKILDLGLALLEVEQPSEEMSRPGETLGTPAYIAPEQVTDSHRVDIRADIYSLGCTLYKLLSGHGPFAEYEGHFNTLMAHVHRVPTPLRKLRPDVPEKLAAILDRMVAKNPADRFATPGQVAEEIEAFTAGSDLAGLLARATGQPCPPPPPPRPMDSTIDYVSPWLSWRRLIALGASLAAILLGIALGVVIWIGRTRLEVPEASEVTVRPDGTTLVKLPTAQTSSAPPSADAAETTVAARQVSPRTEPEPLALRTGEKTAGEVPTSELRVIKPWFPGAVPNDTAPEPPPGFEPVFTHEDLHQFLVKTVKPMRTPQLWRMLYTEIATTIDRGQPGQPATWAIGSGLTSNGKAYEIAVRTGAWFPRVVPPQEAAEKGIQPRTLARNEAQVWHLPVNELVSLQDPDLRVVQGTRGGSTLVGRIRCVAKAKQPIEHLALVIEFPSDKEDSTKRLYQQYRINELPSGWLEVKLEIHPSVNLKHAPRIYLQAFLARPEAGYFRISNELLWMKDP